MTQLRLTPGAIQAGLITFRLALWADGREVAHWPVNSGQPDRQTLRTYGDPRSTPGNYEPIPEAQYSLGPVEWAGRPRDWSASWGNGLGPVWIQIHDAGGGRGAFGFHLDSNRSSAPGSAGCVVFRDRATMEAFLSAYETHRPGALIVDYGLGSVPSAPNASGVAPPAAKQVLEVVAHSGRLRFRVGPGSWRDLDSLKIVGDFR